MLDLPNLLSSKVRQKVFRLYFSQINRGYYLRELERLLHEPVGNIRRELLRWSKAGLFLREKVGNLIYYSLNTLFPLYKELKAIVSKTTERVYPERRPENNRKRSCSHYLRICGQW